MPRNNTGMVSKTEAAFIRSQLKLRQNPQGYYEVYTTAHGTGVFKWWIIDDLTVLFYKENFPSIPTVPFNSTEN